MDMIEELFKEYGVVVGFIVLILAIVYVAALWLGVAWIALHGVSIFYPVPVTFTSLASTAGLLYVIKFLLSK
jgi:hypothetical protein